MPTKKLGFSIHVPEMLVEQIGSDIAGKFRAQVSINRPPAAKSGTLTITADTEEALQGALNHINQDPVASARLKVI